MEKPCFSCSGYGTKQCPTCNGKGYHYNPIHPEDFSTTPCFVCAGKGQSTCEICKGTGKITEQQHQDYLKRGLGKGGCMVSFAFFMIFSLLCLSLIFN